MAAAPNFELWASLFNHLHRGDVCDINSAPTSFRAFDQDGMRLTGRHWDVDHQVDFLVDKDETPSLLLRRQGGDEWWALWQFPFVFNALPDEHRAWHTQTGSHGRSALSPKPIEVLRAGFVE